MTTSLYAAKMAAFPDEDNRQKIRFDMEAPDHAIYVNISEPGLSNITRLRYEHKDRVLLRHSSRQTPMGR
jgi:glutamate dehydrogenase